MPDFVAYAVSRLGERFTLFDIGCSLGIASRWRRFGERLTSYGFDQNLHEIARLQRIEKSPSVHYIAGVVTAPADKRFAETAPPISRMPWDRLAAAATVEIRASEIASLSVEERTRMNVGRFEVSRDTVILPDFIETQDIGSVDFIKIDIDGKDFEILTSLSEVLEPLQTLGFGVEVNFVGSEAPTDHTFHNTDRFMRTHGFDLYDLRDIRRYAGAALPLRYHLRYPGDSVGGRVMQGDALYIRDICSVDNVNWARRNLSATKKLKVAILFSLYNLPDCAAEVINTFADELGSLIELRVARDLLAVQAQTLSGISPEDLMPYDEYVEAFKRDESVFYPDGISPKRLKQLRKARWTPVERFALPRDVDRLGVVRYGQGGHFAVCGDRCRFIPATRRDHIVSNFFEIPPETQIIRVTAHQGEDAAEIVHIQDHQQYSLPHAVVQRIARGVELYCPVANGTPELRLVIHAGKDEFVLPREIKIEAGAPAGAGSV